MRETQGVRDIGSKASPSWPERIVRFIIALVLLAMALAWPLLDIGPKGPNLVTFSSGGGSDARDLLSLPVLLLVVVVLWPLRPRRRTARAKRADRGSR
jgi:uncharacterized RDD family membrane protein YckC